MPNYIKRVLILLSIFLISCGRTVPGYELEQIIKICGSVENIYSIESYWLILPETLLTCKDGSRFYVDLNVEYKEN